MWPTAVALRRRRDLIGGQVPLMVDTASETIEHHKAGKVRILAVTGDARSRRCRTCPRSGIGHQHRGRRLLPVCGPAGMAPDVVARIDRAVADALRRRTCRTRSTASGWCPTMPALPP